MAQQSSSRTQETREQISYSSNNLLGSGMPGRSQTPTGTSRRFARTHERVKSSGVTRKDLEQMADAIGPDFVSQRTNEKEELKTLNNRFARYLKRVQDLERENKILEAQLTQLKSRGPSNLAEKYEEELRRLRQTVDKLPLHMEIDSLRSANDSLNRNMGDLEGRSRREAEGFEDTIRALQNEIEDLKAQMANHLRSYQELMNVKA